MTGLIVNQPEDHIDFLMKSLAKVRSVYVLMKKLNFIYCIVQN